MAKAVPTGVTILKESYLSHVDVLHGKYEYKGWEIGISIDVKMVKSGKFTIPNVVSKPKDFVTKPGTAKTFQEIWTSTTPIKVTGESIEISACRLETHEEVETLIEWIATAEEITQIVNVLKERLYEKIKEEL